MTVAEDWHKADEAEKLRILSILAKCEWPPSDDFLKEDPDVLDAYAEKLGLVRVWGTAVDAAGMRERVKAVIVPELAHKFRKRG